jgi:hypothetical protein
MELSYDCIFLITEKAKKDHALLKLTCSFFSKSLVYVKKRGGLWRVESPHYYDLSVELFTSFSRFSLAKLLNIVHQDFYSTWAAKCGNLELIKYLHENDMYIDMEAQQCAAREGHLDCLKYITENCYKKVGLYTADFAAMGGHLDCLKYLYDRGVLWDVETTAYAARGGHIDCLRFLHENGCPSEATT